MSRRMVKEWHAFRSKISKKTDTTSVTDDQTSSTLEDFDESPVFECLSADELSNQSLTTPLNDKINDLAGNEKPELAILKAIDPRKLEANIPSVEDLYEWVGSNPVYKTFIKGDSRVFWVCGDPDAGRRMIIWSIVRGLSLTSLDPEPEFLSFSMCGTGENEAESVVSVLKTLVYLVLEHQPQLSIHLTEKCDSTGREDFSGPNDVYALTILLYDIIRDATFKPTIFLIEGIDAMDFANQDPSSFMSFIKTTMSLSQNVKWLISSSTESFGHFSKLSDLHIYEDKCMNIGAADEEIQKYLKEHYIPSKVHQLANCRSIDEESKGEGFQDEITKLLNNASSGCFLGVDLACQAIQRGDVWRAPNISKWSSQPLPVYSDSLYSLYTPMRDNIKNPLFDDSDICYKMLSTMATAARPLDLVELEVLLGFPAHINVQTLVGKCFAFLEVRNKTVYFSRKSARDFILKDTESERVELHSQIIKRCLKSLSEYWSLPLTNSSPNQGKNPKAPTNYVALYWVWHLCDIDDADDVIDTAVGFLNKDLLKWLDLLVHSGWLSQATALVSALQTNVKKKWETGARANDSRYRAFLSIIYESYRLLYFYSAIQGSASLTARMMLLFCPSNTAMQEIFLPKEWPYLEGPPMFKDHWDPAIHVIKGHADYIRCCAYSYNGKFLASGSDDGTIRLWDTSSGKAQHTFQAFSIDYALSIALSSTGFIAASNESTIKIWDLSTGQRLKLPIDEYLRDECSVVGDIKFSNGGTMLAATVGRDIVFWNIPEYKLILRQENASPDDNVRFIKFSKHDTLLGSVSKQTITIWSLENDVTDDVTNEGIRDSKPAIQDIRRLKREKNLIIPTSHEDWAYGIAFSPDLKYVATGTDEQNKVYIWDWRSGNAPVDLIGHMDSINTVEFSSDGLFLASASLDGTIRIWREPWAARQPPLILSGHMQSVYDISFSPSDTCIATCSSDETIRIWNYGSFENQVQSEIDSKQSQNTCTSHALPISCIALSEDGKWVASASMDGLICLWDGSSGMLQRSLWEHDQDVESLVFSHDSRKLISASGDKTVRIWSLEDFQSRTLFGHRDWVRCAVLSRDGTLVASGSDDTTIRIWDLMQPEVGHTISTQEDEGRKEMGEMGELSGVQGVRIFYGHRDYVSCVLFSQDGRYIVSGAGGGEIILWDLHRSHQAGSSTPGATIKKRGGEGINAMTFSANSKKFIASDAESISIWDITREDGIMRFEYTLKSETRSAIHSLSVNIKYPQYVITERGPILIQELRDGARAQIVSEPWCPYSVMPDTEIWITWNGRKIILLPDRYHPASDRDDHAVRVHQDGVIIGCQTGEVLIFRFKKNVNWLDVL